MRAVTAMAGLLGALLAASTAAASLATFVPEESRLNLAIGGLLPRVSFTALPDTEEHVSLIHNGMGGHDLLLEPTVFSTVNYGVGTSLYTGVPGFTNARITCKNEQATFESGYTHTNYVGNGSVIGPHLGGVAPLNGSLVLWAVHRPIVPVTLNLAGGPPGIQVWAGSMLGFWIILTGGPWVTGAVSVTGITTNAISLDGVTGAAITISPTPSQHPKVLSNGGGFVSTNGGPPLEYHTVTIAGSNNLPSASQSGAITLVAPMRVAFIDRTPATARMTLHFVPEPGTMLLLAAGAAGLCLLGRKRMRVNSRA